ncbi:glutaredoxin family protein [Propionivibrio dicarboxylicus]|uniref:Glutaredoxin-like domain n=1 Tax=Propionivibrio dicarboxylicus TaxID=83767 RepID=A0A1G8D4V3_9RHOO|nr:glutaredoxin family protein [Propionivibrio dicarboxylicus]SDH52766.1 Glutaredoxin-like domain [Propionivibrio dicarboxylicus]
MAFCLTLISRSYCHLCHDMESEASVLVAEFDGELKVLDVDADPELLALYDERVPVLLHQDEILSQYFLDPGKVRDYLSKIS